MPYSVPPPPLPPVVNVQLPEVSSPTAPSSTAISVPAHSSGLTQLRTPAPAPSPANCNSGGGAVNCNPPAQASKSEVAEGAVFNAAPLGEPLEVSLPVNQLPASRQQTQTSQASPTPTTFIHLPDLDSLMRVNVRFPAFWANRQPAQDTAARPLSANPATNRGAAPASVASLGSGARVQSSAPLQSTRQSSGDAFPENALADHPPIDQADHPPVDQIDQTILSADDFNALTVPPPGEPAQPNLPLVPSERTTRPPHRPIEEGESAITVAESNPEPVAPPEPPAAPGSEGTEEAEPATEPPATEPAAGQVLTIPTPGSQPSTPGQNETQPSEPGSPAEPTTDPTAEPTAEPGSPQSPTPRNRRRAGRRGAVPIDRVQAGEVLEVTADRQEYDTLQQIFRAEGNVRLRFRQGVLTSERLQVNIPNRFAIAEGNAVLTRGQQVIGGDQFSYNFGLDEGRIVGARGQLFLPATGSDFNPTLPTDISAGVTTSQPLADRITAGQPLQVTGSTGGITFGLSNGGAGAQGPGLGQAGQINRLRFEAEQATFTGGNILATNVRVTNDPFSPPELELRSNQVTYTRLSPTQAEIVARNPRLVFDQGFTLPLLINRLVLDNRKRQPGILQFGFDERDRDGFYIERNFDVIATPLINFSVTPQILIQRAIQEGFGGSSFGLVADLDITVSPTTNISARANFASLDFSELEDNLRASVRAQQQVFNHTVTLEYTYRDRLFNGSLGYQNVQSNYGVVVTSPTYTLWNTGVTLSYQGSLSFVNAQTDQQDLYPNNRDDRDLTCIDPDDRDTSGNGCVNLTRYQVAAALDRSFLLWYAAPLPATPTEGLRYTPNPITPYLAVGLGLRGVYSGYSSGDTQANLTGTVGLYGQFGHFSKPFLDYTAFNLTYSATALSGESPFLFDRVADQQVISAGITQQIYGPLRFGVQVSYNLETGDNIDTVYTLEYSRRTYAVNFSYSVQREAAAIGLRISDFNWTGDPGTFSGLGTRPVIGGVAR